jgi:hypothetical protein
MSQVGAIGLGLPAGIRGPTHGAENDPSKRNGCFAKET